jgi:hypothetical protein
VCSQDCGTIAHHPQIMAASSSQSALAEDVFSELDGINEADIDGRIQTDACDRSETDPCDITDNR